MTFIAMFLVTSFQKSPLHVAASNRRDYTVEFLVRNEADMNIKDRTGVRETI